MLTVWSRLWLGVLLCVGTVFANERYASAHSHFGERSGLWVGLIVTVVAGMAVGVFVFLYLKNQKNKKE